jgi:hydroxyethylthiazole kinase-like uncharacterized protein yjeF
MSLLYRTEELRRREATAAQDLPPGTLMARAGSGAAAWIHERRAREAAAGRTHPGRILVLCGPGNNGGDGYSCARALRELGHEVACWAARASRAPEALAARARWEQPGGSVLATLPDPAGVALVVDALFGIGVERPLDEPFLGALRWAGAAARPLIALDLPSGLDGDTGQWVGGVSGAAAAHTLTFLGDKPGLHTGAGIDAAGAVTLDRLGVEEAGAAAPGRLTDPACFAGLLAPRRADSNKGDYGAVAVLGGAAGMVGAALLAGRAALRLGAGKVYVQCLGAPELAVDPLQPELMLRGGAQLPAVDVLVAGCGMGRAAPAHAALERALAHAGPLVLDADALNLLAADAALAARLAARGGTPTVLTPHPGEAARLLGCDTPAVQRDRVGQALALAARSGALVVLKGAGSVIALPPALGARYFINPTGGPALASAGTGDVLAGMIGALLAQHRSAAAAPAALEAVLAAVWLHGRAADDFGADIGLAASDIAPRAAQALAALRRGAAD